MPKKGHKIAQNEAIWPLRATSIVEAILAKSKLFPASYNAKMLKNNYVNALFQCYFGIITHCLLSDQNVLKIQILITT